MVWSQSSQFLLGVQFFLSVVIVLELTDQALNIGLFDHEHRLESLGPGRVKNGSRSSHLKSFIIIPRHESGFGR